ncbi:MAG: pilus assembly PilX N-terminal domain-containing protein [Thermodesulfobacteriota bacterium]
MEPEISTKKISANEQGFVLVASMMILLILVIIGVSATTNTTIELQIAGNDKVAKKIFYKADGGTELAAEVIEHNIACTGFDNAAIHGIYADTLDFWQNPVNATSTRPEFGDRDFCYPGDICSGVSMEVTSLSVGSETVYSTGAAIQQHAGYEGKGKGAAGSGAYLLYDVYSRYQENSNSETRVRVEWRHNIGQEGSCYY